jgi:hypothetical protein
MPARTGIAELLREMIGRLKVPTFAAWCAAERETEVHDVMEMEGLSREEAETKVHPDYPRGPVERPPIINGGDADLPF